FFQAEDGIRDGHVTGVQTCALPISENQNVALFGTYARYDGLLTLFTFATLFWLSVQALADQAEARMLIRVMLASGYAVAATAIRSEERRVGKEWRARWARGQEKEEE